MRVDSAQLRGAEPAVRYLSSSVANLLSRLVSSLDAEGSCWGADQLGNTFANTYLPAAQLIREGLTGLRDDVSGVGDAVLAVADSVDAAEARAQARLS